MYKIGLKLWSNNRNYIKEAVKLYGAKTYDYIELYIVPGTYDQFIQVWAGLNIPYVIHAPHWREKMNLARRECEKHNFELIHETQKYADTLKAEKIIFHPGIAGDIKETARQLKLINDERIIVENKPCYSLYDGERCNGSNPAEIKFLMDDAGVGFCLDIAHAICAANAYKLEPLKFLKDYVSLGPDLYHLADGDYKDIYDKHEHIGRGNYDFGSIMPVLPPNATITIETIKGASDDLSDYARDVEKVKSFEPARVNA